MAKVIFTISYDIYPAVRPAYLSTVEEMKQYFLNVQKKKNYNVFENTAKKNNFSEVFICESEEEYDALEDTMDDTWQSFNNKVQEYVSDGKVQYSVLKEVTQD